MEAPFEYLEDTVRKIFQADYIPKISSIFLKKITTSSQLATKGSLFVPLKGKKFDGHHFIENACELFLCEKNHEVLNRLNQKQKEKAILVENSLDALGILAQFHRKRFNPLTIAVTGSNGKTTTKEILKHFFSSIVEKKSLVYTEKNYNNQIGLPFTIFQINAQTKFLICEIGMNQTGEIAQLSKILKPDIAIITNIGSSHIGNFKNQEEIALEKISILEGMDAKSSLFVNSNIKFLDLIQKKSNLHKIKLNLCPFQLNLIENLENGASLLEFEQNRFRWNLLGKKNLENLNLCLSLLKDIDFLKQDSFEFFSLFKPINDRLSISKNQFEIISDCYNASFESMCSSIEAVNSLCQKDEVFYLVLGDMLELGEFSESLHIKLGQFIEKNSHINGLILVGKASHSIPLGIQDKKRYQFIECFGSTDEQIQKVSTFIVSKITKHSKILLKGSRSIHLERICEGLT